MSILVKVLMMVVGVYLIGLYIFRFLLALGYGELDEDDEFFSMLWPLALLGFLIGWVIDIVQVVCRRISISLKNNRLIRYLRISLYWLFLPFRPAEFGKILHRRLRKIESKRRS